MRILCIILFTGLSLLGKAQYASKNVGLYANFDDKTLPVVPNINAKYSSSYGYFDAVGKREYGILGSSHGTYIIDVTDPRNPVQTAFFKGAHDTCEWREYKTYKTFLYAVSDDRGFNTLQIFDLSGLPVVKKVYDSDSLFSRAHTLFVDGDKLYAASVKKTKGQATVLHYRMAVYSLKDPVNPVFLRSIESDDASFTDDAHDMFVRNDTVFASFGYAGLRVYKFNSQNPSFTLIGKLKDYHNAGYNHSSALTPDGKTLIFADEVPNGLPVKVTDVSDLSDIKILTEFYSNEDSHERHSTPHNPYLVGSNKLVVSYYKDGVQIYDISDRLNPVKIGFFDTYPDNKDLFPDGYAGCWGAYVDLPSGTLLASDMQRGLFILNADTILHPEHLQHPLSKSIKTLKYGPNPFSTDISLSDLPINQDINITVYDWLYRKRFEGEIVHSSYNQTIPLSELEHGLYFLKVETNGEQKVMKIVK